MKTIYEGLLLALGALAVASAAIAQVPSTNDASDGHGNTGSGSLALVEGAGGYSNSGFGFVALGRISDGSYNSACGAFALETNATGSQNAASGFQALDQNSTGSNNTAAGAYALYSNSTGNGNIGIGNSAGIYLTTGSNNIDIGNVGVAGESNTIRIGTRGTQKATVIAGIYGIPVTGSPVVVSATGRLGVTVSSERFKTAIAPMGSISAKLGELRPVTFHLKTDPKGALQYGLIAEEVAKVYPDLVIRDEKDRIDGVRYDELAPMLLNEMQKQNIALTSELRDLKQQMEALKTANEATQAALQKLQATDGLLARR